jgi:hypothetical protein
MVVDHMTFSVVDNPGLRVIALLPEASSIKKMPKIIAAFRGGAGARGALAAASRAKPAPMRTRTISSSLLPTRNGKSQNGLTSREWIRLPSAEHSALRAPSSKSRHMRTAGRGGFGSFSRSKALCQLVLILG